MLVMPILDIRTKDYGLNPTSSTHSAGQVSLAGNPYTVSLYMADMGIPYQGEVGTGWYNIVGGDPQVSVFLCNSPAEPQLHNTPCLAEDRVAIGGLSSSSSLSPVDVPRRRNTG